MWWWTMCYFSYYNNNVRTHTLYPSHTDHHSLSPSLSVCLFLSVSVSLSRPQMVRNDKATRSSYDNSRLGDVR